MSENKKQILVSGATGRQGGAVINHLLKNGFLVRALSRTPDSIPAKVLIAKGVSVVQGDMSDPSSLYRSMNDCYGVFSIQNYFEYGALKEIEYGKNMADAARKNDIQHFIYSSVCNANTQTQVPHFETKNIIENYIREIGLSATIIRPVKFMENYYIPQVFKGILSGKLFDPIPAEKKHQMIAVDDVGAIVAAAFFNRENSIGQSFEIAGEELNNIQIAAAMSEVLGKQIKFKKLPLVIAKFVMDKEMYRMFSWFIKKGFDADISMVKTIFPSVKLSSLKSWLINESWQRWNKKGSV